MGRGEIEGRGPYEMGWASYTYTHVLSMRDSALGRYLPSDIERDKP